MLSHLTPKPVHFLSVAMIALTIVSLLAQSPSPTVSPTPSGPPVEVPHSDPNILYIGRWDHSNPAFAQGYWNGHYFRTKFTGTAVGIRVASPTGLAVSIDGEPLRNITAAPGQTVQLNLKPLANKEHTLQVGSDGQNHRVDFQGLVLDNGGKTLPPTARPVIEFIGDSITTGTNSNYAWLAAEMLGRDHAQISFSGVALTDGFGCSSKTGMEVQYFRLRNYNYEKSEEEFKTPWTFSAYTPEMVVILLGQNDQCGKAPSDAFVAAYKRLLDGIRAKYPGVSIVMLRTLGGPYEKEIRQVWEDVHEKDPLIHHVDTTGWLVREDFSDGIHPNAGGHLKLAHLLANQLEPILQSSKP